MTLYVILLGCALYPSSASGDGFEPPTNRAEPSRLEKRLIAVDHADLALAPYVWKLTGKGPAVHAEAKMPGAYLKAVIRGSTTVGLVVDGTANRGCPTSSMPVIEYSIDEGAFMTAALSRTDLNYTLPLAEGLNAEKSHRIEVFFRAADLLQGRWASPKTHLRIAGIALDAGGWVLTARGRPRKAIAFGDSITEGVGADGLFTSWQVLGVNNARATWFPMVCAALDCEYGQLGSGGLGMTRTLNLPPLPQVWDHYDAWASRLTGGQLLPEPDHVFCSLGTNDYEKDITADYTGWLAAVRRACPRARVFCVVPPLQVHKNEIEAAVASRNRGGDLRVHLIDTAPLARGFRAGRGATQLGHDGVHPSQYGHAMLAAVIAVQVRAILDRDP